MDRTPRCRSNRPFQAALAAVVILWALPASAEAIGSAYTSTAPKDCRMAPKRHAAKDEDPGSTSICPGKNGLIVMISEDDLRETVSLGRTTAQAANEPAAKTWFGPFNSAGPTIEWRLADGKPFAIIQRWQIADNGDPGKDGRPRDRPLLVVTRLPPGAICHVAYIDAAANPDANELARQAADDAARNFACGKDPVKIMGKRGKAIELAMPN